MTIKKYILIVACFVSLNTFCMDWFFSKKRDHNSVIQVFVADGTVQLPLWKIKESVVLRQQYHDHKKEECIKTYATLPIAIPEVTKKGVELCSRVLDCESENASVKFIKSLSEEDEQLLMHTSDMYDKKGKLTGLYIPSIIAYFAMRYLPQELTRKICDYMEKDVIKSRFINNMITRNISPRWGTKIKCDVPLVNHPRRDGIIRLVSQQLVSNSAICFAYINEDYELCIDGVPWKTYCCKKMGNDQEYRITALYKSDGAIEPNERIIWTSNNRSFWRWNPQEIVNAMRICHTSPIINSYFSNDGSYVISFSNREVIVTKIEKQKDGSCSFESAVLAHADIIDHVGGNGPLLSISSITNGITTVKLLNITNNTCATLYDGMDERVKNFYFSSDNTKLLLCVRREEKDFVDLFDIREFSDVKRFPLIEGMIDDSIEVLTYDSKRDSSIILSENGKLMFVNKQGDDYISTTHDLKNRMVMNHRIPFLAHKDELLFIFYPDAYDEHRQIYKLMVWNALTQQCLGSINLFSDSSFGVTADGTQLVCHSTIVPSFIVTLFTPDNLACLKWLKSEASLFELYVLQRLCEKKKTSSLQPQEQTCKAVNIMPSQFECNVRELVKQCFGV